MMVQNACCKIGHASPLFKSGVQCRTEVPEKDGSIWVADRTDRKRRSVVCDTRTEVFIVVGGGESIPHVLCGLIRGPEVLTDFCFALAGAM